MRRFSHLLRRFKADDSGAFAVIFGIIAIVLVATAGAVIDFSSMEQARTRAQVAMDTASLGLQPTIYTATNASLKTQSQALLLERLAAIGNVWTTCSTVPVAPCARVDTVTVNTTEGKLRLDAMMQVPMNFVSLVGVGSMQLHLVSEATRKKLNLEVAMVLDNSNSMATNSRIGNLISAANCAMNILFNADCNSTATNASNANVKIGIVPFTLGVNVGSGNSNASWLDRSGSTSSVSRNNFDSDDYDGNSFTGAVDRIALFDGTNVDWGGCVEERIHDTSTNRLFDTDDTIPSTATPGSLFTPYFAPDEPDSGFYNSYLPDQPASCTNKTPTCTWTQVKKKCGTAGTTAANYGSATCDGTLTTNSYSQVSETGAVSSQASCPGSIFNNSVTATADTYTNAKVANNNFTNTFTRVQTYQYSQRELQERICKYSGATVASPNQATVHGPNGDCPTNAIQPLTATKSQVKAAINALAPQGGTNIHAGAEWGYRILSPDEPFTQGLAYGQATSKVMILMTDGENTAYPWNGQMNNAVYYGSYGYPYNQRLGTVSSTEAQLETEMNVRTQQTCTSAKAAGIAIYTIGLAVDSTADPTANRAMLTNCSSGSGYYFFPAQASDLTDVFTTIANQLAALRLVK